MPTTDRSPADRSTRSAARAARAARERTARDFGIQLHGSASPQQGIVHVIGPELGLTQPGMTIVCGDSHTARTARSARWRSASAPARWSTCSRRSACCSAGRRRFEVRVEGKLQPGRHGQGHHPGADRAHRHRRRHRPRHRVPRLGDPRAVDGRADDRLQHVDRGRRARRPDRARRHDVRVPRRAGRTRRRARRGTRRSRAGGSCRPTTAPRSTATITLDAAALEPMITYGTNPGMGIPITAPRPGPRRAGRCAQRDSLREGAGVHGPRARQAAARAARSTSCSSAAAPTRASPTCASRGRVLKGRKVADGVRVLVVPGLERGEAPGRGRGPGPTCSATPAPSGARPGCSMCIAMNGDQLSPGQYAVSTQQPQLRRPAGQGRPHVPRQPADRGRRRGHRQRHRRRELLP